MKDRIGLFDGLKGIAILGIFCIHVGVNQGVFSGILLRIFEYGNRGVELSYIICSYLLVTKFEKLNSKRYPFDILKTRIVSILPLYLIYFFYTYFFVFDKESKSLIGLICNVFMVNVFSVHYGNYIGGSLYFSCMIVCTIVYLWYIRLVDDIEKSIIIGLIVEFVATMIIPIIISYKPFAGDENIYYLLRAISSFVIGHMLYFVINSSYYQTLNISNGIRNVTSFVICAVFFLSAICGKDISAIIIEWMFVALILINYKKSILLFDNILFVFLGKRIFQIFIWHTILMGTYGKFNNKYVYFLFVFLASILLAEVTYQLEGIIKKYVRGKKNVIFRCY